MNNCNFLRALGILGIYQHATTNKFVNVEQLGIPKSVFNNPMILIPVGEVDKWYGLLEQQTGDSDIILKLADRVDIERLGPLSNWFFSGHDLASSIRRVNIGLHCLQSGAFLYGAQVGKLIKWCYDNPAYSETGKVHDSIRVAIFMMKILRRYLGDDFTPAAVSIAGYRDNTQLYQEYFGCNIQWGQPRTEIWIPSHLRLSINQSPSVGKMSLAMNFHDLDNYLNMPDAADEHKVTYEMINYSRHFGLPTLHKVSSLLGLSEQQFQRRLHKLGVNFSTIMGYALSNVAVELLLYSVPVEEVATRLGYTNVASFNRMFKKHRGLTPKQYVERLKNGL
ncbi:AraC family transcriptional regulator [Vibrio splendidus]|uniref:AraC family transcriptional regulator n=1 Tax=Vibrio splendidus TaxID=29497 RepID=UPI000C83422B|nr:AraC family transcriptional regulator [Vibrio splendidus]PMO71589.1 AraC family transcriptional regulator [Vibrio splendidus]PTP83089.1 AraC family transcriptional regulator [Vibrio splendidus]